MFLSIQVDLHILRMTFQFRAVLPKNREQSEQRIKLAFSKTLVLDKTVFQGLPL